MILDPLEPLALSAIILPFGSSEDLDRQMWQMWRVNCIASEVLGGDRPADDLLAAVESVGVDPDRYCEMAIARMEQAIVNDVMSNLDPGEGLAYAH